MDIESADRVSIRALGSAYFAGCKEILSFIGEVAAPRIVAKTSVVVDGHAVRNPMFFPLACHGMVSRIHGWFITLGKLDNPADFQAVAGGSRAMFELAIDLTLLKFEEKGSMGKLMAWHFASKLRIAERRIKSGSDTDGKASEFVKAQTRQVNDLRAQYWGSQKWRDRWTGRNLREDSIKAETFAGLGFTEYYAEHYPLVCWNVHGSGVNSMLDAPDEVIPYFAARAFRDAAHFAKVSLRTLFELLDIYDEQAQAQFEELEMQIARAYSNILDPCRGVQGG